MRVCEGVTVGNGVCVGSSVAVNVGAGVETWIGRAHDIDAPITKRINGNVLFMFAPGERILYLPQAL